MFSVQPADLSADVAYSESMPLRCTGVFLTSVPRRAQPFGIVVNVAVHEDSQVWMNQIIEAVAAFCTDSFDTLLTPNRVRVPHLWHRQ